MRPAAVCCCTMPNVGHSMNVTVIWGLNTAVLPIRAYMTYCSRIWKPSACFKTRPRPTDRLVEPEWPAYCARTVPLLTGEAAAAALPPRRRSLPQSQTRIWCELVKGTAGRQSRVAVVCWYCIASTAKFQSRQTQLNLVNSENWPMSDITPFISRLLTTPD